MSHPTDAPGNTLTLIQGEFSVADATEQLMKLYNDELRYHSRRAFSSEIRFGTSDNGAQAMLKALDRAKQETLELLNQANGTGRKVKIETAVRISVA